jgi:hypothetical protein
MTTLKSADRVALKPRAASLNKMLALIAVGATVLMLALAGTGTAKPLSRTRPSIGQMSIQHGVTRARPAPSTSLHRRPRERCVYDRPDRRCIWVP